MPKIDSINSAKNMPPKVMNIIQQDEDLKSRPSKKVNISDCICNFGLLSNILLDTTKMECYVISCHMIEAVIKFDLTHTCVTSAYKGSVL